MHNISGDFLDRGPMQNEVLLFIFLMKLRWPKYVYLLRGNHELYELTKNDFEKQVLTKHTFRLSYYILAK